MSKLMGLGEIAQYLRVSRRQAREWIRSAGLPAARTNREWVSDSELLDVWWREMVESGGFGGREAVNGTK